MTKLSEEILDAKVKRYTLELSWDGPYNLVPDVTAGLPQLVLASDYDALAQRAERLEAERDKAIDAITNYDQARVLVKAAIAERDALAAKLRECEQDAARMRQTLQWLRGETGRESIHRRIDAALSPQSEP